MKKVIFLFLFLGLFNQFVYAKTNDEYKKAIFAGGCFWCVQHDFDQVKGVVSTTAGYTGGTKVDPTYEEVSAGGTGHVEAVEVIYDPSKVSYETLLGYYWHNIDPTRDDGQFCDQGEQYRPVIFYTDAKQKRLAEEYKQEMIKEGRIKPIRVEILPAQTFYPAETYHQEYYKKNPIRYNFYRERCGRDNRLKQVWGSKAEKP
jgi:peptide-methionine (S)-S-oxide reductase